MQFAISFEQIYGHQYRELHFNREELNVWELNTVAFFKQKCLVSSTVSSITWIRKSRIKDHKKKENDIFFFIFLQT